MKKLAYFISISLLSLNLVFGQQLADSKSNHLVGDLPGSISINPDGSSSYVVTLKIPPGRAGMEPEVSLIYNSMTGNGPLGMGWSIGEIQTISRGATNLYFEEYIDGIDFDDNDTYYYNGQRLLEVGPNEYRTEKEGYSKIIAEGTAGSGPQSFKVYRNDGIEFQFGKTTNSRIEASGRVDVLFWRLNRIIDKRGNYINYIYDESSHEGLISKIEYVGNEKTGELPFNTIEFTYSSRTDNNKYFIHGSVIEQNKLLDKIETKYKDQLINTYQLTYTYDQLKNEIISPSKLANIQLLSFSGSTIKPTVFTWGEKTDNFEFDHTLFEKEGFIAEFIMGDFDGNGKTDVLAAYYFEEGNDNVIDLVVVYYSNGDGTKFTAIEDSRLNYYIGNTTNIIAGDYNGDGKTDLALIMLIGHLAKSYRIMLSASDGFQHAFWKRFYHENKHDFINVDINGNGIDELALISYDNPINNGLSRTYIKIIEIMQNGINRSYDEKDLTETYGDNGYYYDHLETGLLPIQIGDFNGDGKTNIMINKYDRHTSIFQYDEVKLKLIPIGNDLSYPNKTDYKCFTGDFNGDGITDIFTKNKIKLFDGLERWYELDCPVSEPEGNQHIIFQDFKYQIADFNGDGKDDILQFYHEYFDEDVHDEIPAEFKLNHWVVHYSNGLDFYNETFLNDSYKTFTERLYVNDDLDGDGNNDFIMPETGRIMFFNKNEKSNIIHKFTNGFGHETSLEYDYLTNNSFYEKGLESVYPLVDIQLPKIVVTKLLMQNGIGGFFETNYSYKQAVSHRRGKGFLGFGEFIIKNKTTNKITEIKFEIYDKDAIGDSKYFFPYIVEESVYSTLTNDRDLDVKDKLLEKTINTLDIIASNNSLFGYYPVVIETLSYYWDNDWRNSLLRTVQTIQDKRDIDIYGNSIRTIKKEFSSENKYSKPTRTTVAKYSYLYDEKYWILNRLASNEIIISIDDGEYTTQTLYEYYSRNETGSNGIEGWPLAKTLMSTPENDELYKKTTVYEYDIYGNVTLQTLKTLDLNGEEPYKQTIKVVENNYPKNKDYHSRYLTKSTVKVGPGYETRYTYEPQKGLLTSTTEPNGLKTLYYYNDIGDLVLTRYADDNYLVSVLLWVTNDNPDAPKGSLYYRGTLSSGSSMKRVFYDKLTRPLRYTREGMTASQKIFIDTKYDDRGLVKKVSEPFFHNIIPDENDNNKWTEFKYDRIGRPVFKISPTNVYVTLYKGLEVSIIERNTKIRRLKQKNSLGQIILENDPSGDIKYTYYPSGQLKSTDAFGKMTVFEYDAAGNKSKTSESNLGTIAYKYSNFGELLKQTDNSGNITTMEYDLLGRLTKKDLNGDLTTYTYNELLGTNGFGLLKRVSAHKLIKYEYEYDNYSRLLHDTKTIENIKYRTSMEYDAYGRLSTYTYPSNYKINYLYTSETGMFYQVIDHETGNMLFKTNEINQRGQLRNYSLGNGLQTTKAYDKTSGLVERIYTGEVQNLAYDWDNTTKNLIKRFDFSYDKSLEESFEYDELLKSRLVNWQVREKEAYSMSYKHNGNIYTKSDVTINGTTVHGRYEYNNHDKPNAVKQIFLPKPDYILANPRQDIIYTSFNKVGSILQEKEGVRYDLDFIYGPDNTRKKTILYKDRGIEKTKYFISDNYEIEYDHNDNQRILHYINGADGLFAIYEWIDNKKTMYYVHKDHLGSYETISDNVGNLVEKLSFDPWGRRRNAESWSYEDLPTNYLFDRGFTTHEHLDVFGLVNMNGRVYDAWLGSFLSPDPILQTPSNIQNYNRYSYALNNPLKYIDPSGYFYEEPWLIGSTRNPYRAAIISTTAHGINASFGFSYGSYAYRNSSYRSTWTGNKVSYSEVRNNMVLPNSITLFGKTAQSLYGSINGGMSIYCVNAFGKSTLVSAFGKLGSTLLSKNGGINFTNPTAGGYGGEFTFGLRNKNYWGEVLPNLNRHQINALNNAAIVMGTVALIGYSAGPEVGVGVHAILTIPSLAIAITTTADAWGDYYRMENPTKGQFNRVLVNTTLTFSGVVFLPLAIPAASFGIFDQNGNFNQYWNSFDKK